MSDPTPFSVPALSGDDSDLWGRSVGAADVWGSTRAEPVPDTDPSTRSDVTTADGAASGGHVGEGAGSGQAEVEEPQVMASIVPRDPAERRRVYTALLRAVVDERSREEM